MYRFNSAVRLLSLFTTTATANSTKRFPYPFGSRRRHGGSVDQKILPPEFSRNVVRLTCESTAQGGVCEVYVVGTIHGYPKSLQDVKSVVNFVKPQAVFLELCPGRADLLSPSKVKNVSLGPLSYKFTFKYVESEFRVAFEEANKLGAKVILGDRPMKITERRFKDKFARRPFWAGFKKNLSFLLSEPKKAQNLDDQYKEPFT